MRYHCTDGRRVKPEEDGDAEVNWLLKTLREGKRPKQIIAETQEELRQIETSYRLSTDWDRQAELAGQRDAVQRKLDTVVFNFVDSAATVRRLPPDDSAELAELNRRYAEHHARNGMPAKVEGLAALPANPSANDINRRNAEYWGGN